MSRILVRSLLALSVLGACRAGTVGTTGPQPTCTDHEHNGSETDVDCGGSCPGCPDGAECRLGGDCDSGVCDGAGEVCSAPSCSDQLRNGDESDRDCGGGCEPCEVEGGCAGDGDCRSTFCEPMAQRCAYGLTCTNEARDADESDVDCGGVCAPCATGADCGGGADCASGICAGGTCVGASCGNSQRDGGEAGVDCGGPCPTGCPDGTPCAATSDCASRFCDSGFCAPAACGDLRRNGSEDCDAADLGADTCVTLGSAGGALACAADCTFDRAGCFGCGNARREGAEVCDGEDLAGATCQSLGFTAGALSCAPDCAGLDTSGCARCGNDVRELSEVCDGAGLAGATCASLGYDAGILACAADCSAFATGGCSRCRDGVRQGPEVCDGADLTGATCADRGWQTGTLACALDCAGFAEGGCSTCGDLVRQGDEVCDGTDVAGESCDSQGHSGGVLACAGDCSGFVATGCTDCGNGVRQAGEVCDGSDVGGASCASLGYDDGALACNAGCAAYDTSRCNTAAVCGDGVRGGPEQCDGAQLAGASCQSLGFDGGALGCVSACAGAAGDCTCAYDTSACYRCDNGRIDAGEACDGADLGGATCATLGRAGGTLLCAADCQTFDAAGCTDCGDDAVDGAELCDGADLGGATCASLGLTGGQLACDAACAGYDTSRCCGTCGDGATCDAATGRCECALHETLCDGMCTSPRTDPDHCGSCDVQCAAGQACSAGVCAASCQAPLIACDRRCVDPRSDNVHCGAGASCTTSPGTDCTATGKVCNGGTCVTGIPVGPPPAVCAGGGPPISLGTGGSLDCAGNLAAVSFRWGLCSCSDIVLSQTMFVDGYDATLGPYTPGGTGGGLGTDGQFRSSSGTTIGGDLWASGPTGINASNLSAAQGLRAGGLWKMKSGAVGDDAYAAGNISATAVTIGGDLFQSPGGTRSGVAVSGTIDQSAAVSVPPPCDCSASQLVDVAGIVSAHATSNDNGSIGLSPTVFAGAGGRVDLPCGNYYFSGITGAGAATIVVHGNTAIYVGGDISKSNPITLTLDEASELDVFVGGGLCFSQVFTLGSPSYPARTRIYVAGTNACGQSGTSIKISAPVNMAANLYAPFGTTTLSQQFLLYGGILARQYTSSQVTTIHFDRSVVREGDICNDCGDALRADGEVCDGPDTGGASCTSLGYAGGTLGACSPTCDGFDTSGCCGDSVRGAAEVCDGADRGGATCVALGFPGGGTLGSCNATCDGFDTSGCHRCGDSVRQGAEACDGPDLGGVDCGALGFSGGTLTCRADCRAFDTSQCTTGEACGNGVRVAPEVCDGADLAGASCASLGYGPGTLGCAGDCRSFDTRACCGDGVRGGGEACDGLDLGGATCTSRGYASGSLGCRADCTFATAACCGDGVRGGSEGCDGTDLGGATCTGLGYAGGTLACTAACALDPAGCTSQCASCRDCNNQACVGGRCGACATDADCCAPLRCLTFIGQCGLF